MHHGRRSLKWLPLLLFPILLLASCSESDDTVEEYPDWQATNTTYWTNIVSKAQTAIASGDTSWKLYRNFSIEDSLSSAPITDYIVVNVLESGTGSGSPLYTDSVRVRYEGRLLPSTSYADGYVFDTTWPDGTTDATAGVADFLVSGLTDGFATAVQHMHSTCLGRWLTAKAAIAPFPAIPSSASPSSLWPTAVPAAAFRCSRQSVACG